MQQTLSDAKADLYSRFVADADAGVPVAALTKTARVFLGEPEAGKAEPPISITIFTAGGDAQRWRFEVRIYGAGNVDALEVQTDLDITIQEVLTILEATDWTVESDWAAGWVHEISAWVVLFQVWVGRRDVF